jgi:hypothetical protein
MQITASNSYQKEWTKGWSKFWSKTLKRGTGDSHGECSVV